MAMMGPRGLAAATVTLLAALAVVPSAATTLQPAASPATTREQAPPDVPSDAWFHDGVQWAIDQGALLTYGDGTFRPREPLTRRGTAAALWRLAGEPTDVAAPTPPLTDVPVGDQARRAIHWAVDRGIIRPTANRRFRPDAPTTRSALGLALWRWAGSPDAPARSFPDVPAGSRARPAFSWLADQRIFVPGADGTMRPRGKITRAQVAVALQQVVRVHETGPPNLVMILTDDQTLEMMRVMPQVQDLLADEGTTFANAFATFPLCCPSRATLLTGQYSHNHGVRNNVLPRGGHLRLDHSNTLATWLQRDGYATAHVGKYLNCYGSTHRLCGTAGPDVPAGWDDWFGLPDPLPANYGYTSFDALDNGTLRHFGPAPDVYQTDVLADRAVADIHQFGERPQPFFLNVWTLAPHSGQGATAPNSVSPAPSPRYAGSMSAEPLPAHPSYGEADLADKPAYVRGFWSRHFANQNRVAITRTYRAMLESLRSVDDLVASVVEALSETGRLDRTVILFTSDNGWMFGEHRITFDKVVPYEESIHVPLVVRGPGFPAGATATQIVGNIDVAPTFLDLADARADRVVDGRSLVPIAGDASRAAERAVLLENWPTGTSQRVPHYTGIRVQEQVYLEYDTGERELYDLAADPFQLTNLADDPAWGGRRSVLANALARMRNCSGATCEVTVPTRGP